jgi:hypothetical protein
MVEREQAPRDETTTATAQGVKSRRALITRTSASIGKAWACGWRQQLAAQGRAVTGGWPGTMSEARARVAKALMPELLCVGVIDLSFDENEHAARTIYGAARRQWLSRHGR